MCTGYFNKNFTIETFRLIETWFAKSINNWAHADTLGMYILPKFFLSNHANVCAMRRWGIRSYFLINMHKVIKKDAHLT